VKKEGRYFFSVVEECVMNKEYQWGRGGRIEVYDSKDKSGYALYEARFFIPKEFINTFREVFDFKTSNRLPFIRFDCDDINSNVNYVNLTAGLLQNRYEGQKIRLQSSHLESHSYDRFINSLSDDLLYNLAIGRQCTIVDCSSNYTGKIKRRGLPIIKYILDYIWFKKETIISPYGLAQMRTIYQGLSKTTKQRIKYYRKFLHVDDIRLRVVIIPVYKEKY